MTRRQVLTLVPGSMIALLGPLPATASDPEVYTAFPAQEPDRVRQVVGASHRDFAKVKELVIESPALAKAVWDWGFGDWESALGAASHTGQREIADFLVANGARPDIFYFAMAGNLEVVKAVIAATPEIVSWQGPHGISLLSHAEAGEAAQVVEYLKTVKGAEVGQKSLALDDAAREVYLGKYSFGPGPNDHLEAYKNRRGWLVIRRGEAGNPQRLNRVGDHEFAPPGAPAVRIRFTVENGRAVSLTIHDHVLLVSAKRV